jgi:hypothetical protein
MPAAATEIEHMKPVNQREGGLRQAAFETAWIFLIFFLFAGSPPPDVGEAHYLAKAKHYWDPAWCAGDLFLESRDAHGMFTWGFGWVTRLFSLPASAWIGRMVTWGLLAWSWRRLSWAVVPRPLWSLLSAGLMLLFLRNFHLAGEWVVGGVEAKGFAYPLVFLALEAMVRGRWQAALLLAGGAGAFHVLVGGWTVVAIGIAWVLVGKERPSVLTLIPAAIGGLVLSLPGLIPAIALNWGVPKDVAAEAARIYVFERLSHHLVFHRFAVANQIRFVLLLVAWLPLAWSLRREAGLWRLQLVVAGAVVIAWFGVLIDQGAVIEMNLSGKSAAEFERGVAGLLRYYWYRMSDSLLPVGMTLAIVWWLARLQVTRPARGNWLLMAAILLALANLADVGYWRWLQPLPGAILQPKPTNVSSARWWFSPLQPGNPQAVTAEDWTRDWKAACTWIEANTPADAKFLTPRSQQTFKWYAGRAEVANWKDVPQDAAALVAWRKIIERLYPGDRRHHRMDLAAHTDEDLIRLAHETGAGFVVIDQTRANRAIGLPRVYPLIREDNRSFSVYRVPGEREASESR